MESTVVELWSELDIHDRQYTPFDGMPQFLTLQSIRAIVTDYGLNREYTELIADLDKTVTRIRQKNLAAAAKKNKGKTGK